MKRCFHVRRRCGGAALAFYEHFLKMTQRPLIVLRRTPERDSGWVKPAGRVEFLDLDAPTLDVICKRYPKNLLLQTTSAPLYGDRLDHLLPGLLVELVVLCRHAYHLYISCKPTQ